jgi:8-oxo-dGTP diphosphatase
MKTVALCLPVDQTSRCVLLGIKRRGFGQGKLTGLGGKVYPGEDLAEAAARELCEEAGLLAGLADLEEVAQLTFCFPTAPDWNHRMVVFIVRAWRGQPTASEEITPEWHPVDALPFERMWDDARLWLPMALADQRVAASFVYGEDGETVVEARVRKVANFSEKLATFCTVSPCRPASG